MRLSGICLSAWIAASLVLGASAVDNNRLQQRQDNTASGFPTLGSGNRQTDSASTASGASRTATQSAQSASNTGSVTPSQSGTGSPPASTTHNGNNTSSIPPTSSISSLIGPTSTISGSNNSTTNITSEADNELPLPPRITPALSIGGVILIITGIVYAVIGVKNRWIHIFLSTAYLTSLSITVLIVYVANPPISDAIQGAYFVGIFMTGVIFGGGALIFKEVTEGLGCLLGGFCLSMWFLTLKEGGLITSTGGKAIFISAFCIIAWSLSFSHYTRAYGLMGSTSFSGATAFVLGIDCFSRGGLKEFWVYIWHLNDNLFPLNTNTYPITRGTRVQSIVIVLACIIGIISQIKLWKIVKDRQKRRNEAVEDESRRREVVEAALGRHLERQNDRDRSQWERQYGDRLNAKRDTILWTDAHTEKGYSKIRESEIGQSQNSSSSESLEMTNMARKSRSMYVTRIKRSSGMPVTAIPEVEETEGHNKAHVRQMVLDQLEGNSSTADIETEPSTAGLTASPRSEKHRSASTAAVSRERSPASGHRRSAIEEEDEDRNAKKGTDEKRKSDLDRYLSAPPLEEKKKKRRSFAALLSRSPNRSPKDTDDIPDISQSQEALVLPETALRHSRASSLAATLDFENEKLELPTIDLDIAGSHTKPEIVVSPVETLAWPNSSRPRSTIRRVSSEPELGEENLDIDPEEFVRPAAEDLKPSEAAGNATRPGVSGKRKSENGTENEILYENGTKPDAPGSVVSQNEILTRDALEQMPSQLSHLVLSYRTNEWAKHISTADAPLVEEPEPINDDKEAEPPTHLADPTSPTESKRSSLAQPVPPQVPAPVPSALPSPTEGIRINPVIQSEQPTISAVVAPTAPAQAALPSRVRSTSETSNVPRGFRSTSTPMLVKQPLQATAIDENQEVSFVPQQNIMRSPSTMSVHQLERSASQTQQSSRPGTTLSNYQPLVRSGSRLSMVSEHGAGPVRSNSQMSHYQPAQAYHQGPYMHNPYQQQASPHITMPSRSDTRLQFYDSHQPVRRDDLAESQRREAMFADWRVGQQKLPTQQEQAEMHRYQMLMERQQVKMMEEQEKNYKWQQELAVDARMRGRDMQELHREAMRKMQAGVNRKMTN